MKLLCSALASAALVIGAFTPAYSATEWKEGVNYFVVQSAEKPTIPPGKVLVTEVFSYGCPHCSEFRPVIKQLKASLPANAVLISFDVAGAALTGYGRRNGDVDPHSRAAEMD